MTSRTIPIAPGAAAVSLPPAGLDAQTPLLLLPVNIQTRFVDPVDGQHQLWVRIYPDQIAVNSHEPELTDGEVSDGKAYWNALWEAGKPPAEPDDLKAPWRMLVSLYGAPRAAWIALQMTPTNVAAQPVTATPTGTTPVPAPAFPTPPSRNSSWEKPAIADALPDAWTVVLFAGTQSSTFRSSPVQTPLSVSLTPNGPGFPADSPVDAGLQWMVDFETAVTAGMALKIPLTAAQRSSGFDRILVYGLRSTDTAARQTFANLLDAHHYTDGFALVPQGAPTNNTPDASSAYSRKDPDAAISFQTERMGPLNADPTSDGQVFSTLTGIPPGTLDHVAYAAGTNNQNGTDMFQALWPATLGYFLHQMMADVFTPAQIEQGRQFVVANAIPRGPISALRVGKTPYGVLPVTSLRNYAANPNLSGIVEPGLTNFVTKLWPTWLASSAAAPHMQRGGDPDQNLMSVLGMDASSMNFQGRPVLGSGFVWNFFNFLGVPASFQGQWFEDYQLFGRALLNLYGFGAWNPNVLNLAFAEKSFPVQFPTVQTGALSETDPLKADADLGGGVKGNYINWLQTASVADLHAENYPGPKPTSLLYKILRQSLLLDYANLAGQEEVRVGNLQLLQLRETEILAVQPVATVRQAVAAPLTPLELLARPAIANPRVSWAEYLVATNFGAGSPYAQLNEVRASLTRLASLPTAELDRLLTETLDACSHRLDVWATAIATSLLKRVRAQQNSQGLGAPVDRVYLGCYAWMEDIRPETGRLPVQGTELQLVRALDARGKRSGLAVPFQPLTDNGGFIHAPSDAQAAVAAVLRNGYMTHQQTAEAGLLSIDLSSDRVRRALGLISGVQQGQSLNALLGYLFEDNLHAQKLDKYIQAFRDQYPVVGSKLTSSSAPSESVAASNVVDGVALRTAWDSGKLVPGGTWGPGLPGPGVDQNAVIAVLQTLDDYADALGDLSLAEAVFQVIRGNFGRGGGLLDAISRGSRPPTPDVVDTPRGGIDLSHRVVLLFAGTPVANPAWAGVTSHPKAAAEPWLDAWLGNLLPDPAIVRCQVQYEDSGPQTKTVSLLDLNAGPQDLLFMAEAAEVPQRSELENRILFAAALPGTAENPKIVFDPGSLPAGSILFPDVLYLAQSLRHLVGAGRALEPQNLTTPENNAEKAGGSVDLGDLQLRAGNAVLSLKNDLAALIAAAPGPPGPLRNAMLQASFYGAPGVVPYTSTGPDPNLATQAQGVIKILQDRFNQASAVVLATATLADLQGVFAAIFGGDFVVLPRFTPPDLTKLQTAFTQSSALVASDPLAPSRWFRQLIHIRPALSRLDLALNVAQALGAKAYPPDLLLGQLPPPPSGVPPDRWLGLPLDPANLPQKGRIALECVTQGNPATESSYAGLILDEWNERIPSTKESASVAFHFEEASGRAPQALLLAVCPDNRRVWDDSLLQAILEETLELAKIRTVDLNSVEQIGQILPALYFALNLGGATFSTRFAILKETISVIGLTG